MLVEEIVKLGYDSSCIICDRALTDEDVRADDVEAIVKEPPYPFGRFVKGELRLFHKGTGYHVSCYYQRKYRLD